jgi:hypothetical protein
LNSLFLDLLWSLAYLYTAFEARSKLALATTTSLNLSFKDQSTLVAESGSNFLCLLSCFGETAFLNIDTVFAHNVF